LGIIKSVCPLDCWDQCAFEISEKDGLLISIGPDRKLPVTGNFICSKGRSHLERFLGPNRLKNPLLKVGSSFKVINWDDAMQLMAEKITTALHKHGPLSLLHFYDGGYNGLLKNIESRFFSALGGCTSHKGSLCWGAGLAAQKYDFGASVGHGYNDLPNAKYIIIWGRNPAYTSIHLLPFLRLARENGAKAVLIDPVRTASASDCDQYVRINPGTDGALALAMARVIIESNLLDYGFIDRYSSGYNSYRELCLGFDLNQVAGVTGISVPEIEDLALSFASAGAAAILIGIGLQRHSNGGNTVRAIDALAALTGNIGKKGGGATYANFRISNYIDHDFLDGNDLHPQRRYYAKPMLAEALTKLKDPPIEFMYISRSNPVVQVADSNRLVETMKTIPFIVTAEHFLTDTAKMSDLVLPCSSFLEEEGLFYNSMSHQYISYAYPAAKPPGECRSEYSFLKELARLINCNEFPQLSTEDLLRVIIKPMTDKHGITLEYIKNRSPLLFPDGEKIPWEDYQFMTEDGRYHFFSDAAEKECGDGLPVFRKPLELSNRDLYEKGFKYWFHTPHARESIHSTNRQPRENDVPKTYVNPVLAEKENLAAGDKVKIASPRGSMTAVLELDEAVLNNTVMVYQGWWHASGAAVNCLTPGRVTDMGLQAAYYDCLCQIEKI